jgi:hypothetical protein
MANYYGRYDPFKLQILQYLSCADDGFRRGYCLSMRHCRSSYIPSTYPNFTLPVANMSQPPLPPTSPNYALILSPTSPGFANGLEISCFLSPQKTFGTISIANESLWARGFKMQWLGCLTPTTNYTAFVLKQNNTKVSGPIFFATKSGHYSLIMK